MLIIKGVNVYPSQLEAALLTVADLAPHYQLVVDRREAFPTLAVQVEPDERVVREWGGFEAAPARLRRAVRAGGRVPARPSRAHPGDRGGGAEDHPAQRGQGGAGRGKEIVMAERDEARLLARIEAGERIESPDEMTEAYRENLIHLMTMQADSELAGGYGYVPWITKAPGVEEKHVVAQIVKDELRHATVMYGLLADLGVDVEAHVRAHDEAFTMRIANDADIGTARITADKRVNIFYYPIDTWADFIFFNFCMDRGAGHQLEDVRACSYGPWVRAIEGIFKEEKFHIRHGEFWVKRLAEDPKTRDEAQATLNKWYIRTMNIFGRPGSAKNVLYRKYRLKLRDNDEVRQTFAREVAEKAGAVGLTLPEWNPVWDRLPEEAQIPG